MKENLESSNFAKKESYYRVVADLLEKIAKKDTAALSSLYDLTSAQIYGIIYQLIKDPTIAEEVLSDTYLYIWHNAENYDQQRGKPVTRLFILARSRAVDQIRRYKWKNLVTQDISLIDSFTLISVFNKQPSPEESFFDSERQKSIQNALKKLPDEQRKVIELAYYGGFSHREIAVETNQPIGTVKTRIKSGTDKLRELLKPLIEDKV